MTLEQNVDVLRAAANNTLGLLSEDIVEKRYRQRGSTGRIE